MKSSDEVGLISEVALVHQKRNRGVTNQRATKPHQIALSSLIFWVHFSLLASLSGKDSNLQDLLLKCVHHLTRTAVEPAAGDRLHNPITQL